MTLRSRIVDIFRGGHLRRARLSEGAGRLEEAAALYLQAERLADAARVVVARARLQPAAQDRLALLTRAVQLQPDDAPVALERAELELELVETDRLDRTRAEVVALGRELQRLGAHAPAARAFALCGDLEAQVHALTQAGDIDHLEAVLDAHNARELEEADRADAFRQIQDSMDAGRRRDALGTARRHVDGDERFVDMVRHLEDRRACGPVVRLELSGVVRTVAFGARVVVGRSGADVQLSSPRLSRRHLEIRRGARGPEVADLDSGNGTWLGGARVGAPLAVGDGLKLDLAGDVPLSVEPAPEFGRHSVRLLAAGLDMYAPLGRLATAGLQLEPSEDGWLEIVSAGSLILGDLAVSPPIQLCIGDAIRRERGGPVVLRVLE